MNRRNLHRSPTVTLSTREFNQAPSRAKRAADAGPVVIANHGKPAYVLLSHDDYRRLLDNRPSIRQLLGQPGTEAIEFEPPRLGAGLFRVPELD